MLAIGISPHTLQKRGIALDCTRPEGWDSWHLSTGPLASMGDGTSVMFYNGAAREANRRIGWICFDANYTRVISRCENPIIAPPARRDPDATDIAFASSAIDEDDEIAVYYSIADKDMYRASIRVL